MTETRPELWGDFCRFARAQIVSGDIDPMYPLLRRFYDAEGWNTAAALWRTLLYVTWYHIGSAEQVWRAHPEPGPIDAARFASLPTGVERRGFRGTVGCAAARAFVAGVLRRANGDLLRWAESFGEGPSGWTRARQELEAVKGAGPWASFKWADLLRNVHGFPLVAPDIGVGGRGETAGPIPGMVALTGRPWQECAGTPALQRELLEKARAAGVPLGGLDQLETCLCDFNSLIKGTYYVGHDIDMQQVQLQRCGAGLWEARAVFPESYRGELRGWCGVDKARRRAYRDQGVILVR